MNLKDISINSGTQSRDLISDNTVAEYAELMSDGTVFPPLDVFFDGLTHYLVDGFHRYFGYTRIGVSEVEVIIHKGTLRDAIYFSKTVNKGHGLQRSISTKRKIIRDVLNDLEWQDYSDRKLASDLGVSHTYIQKMRKELDKPQNNVAPHHVKLKTKEPKAPEVTTLKPVEEIDHREIEIKELSALNEELHQENLKYKDQEMVIEGDVAETLKTIEDLRKQISILEMENRAIKNTRDQLQAKNAELVKSVNYWKKKYEKSVTA